MASSERLGQVSNRARVLRKVFITLPISGLGYFVTNLSNQPQIWSISASIFIGGITLVVQFLHDFENRLEKVGGGQAIHFTKMQSLIKTEFARTNDATKLFHAVEASGLQIDEISNLLRNAARISPDSPPLVYNFAQLQINRLSQFLKDLSEGGQVSYDGEDQDWILGLTRQSQRTIDAIGLELGNEGLDRGLWTSEFGQRYLEHQGDAIRRRVAIRRLFIVDRSDQTMENEFLSVCEQQMSIGIQVRILDQSNKPKHLKNPLLDFVVFDSVISYEFTPATWGSGGTRRVVKTHLVLQPEQVKERMQKFENLWESAGELK